MIDLKSKSKPCIFFFINPSFSAYYNNKSSSTTTITTTTTHILKQRQKLRSYKKFQFFSKKRVGMTCIYMYNLTQMHSFMFTNPHLHEMNGCHASGTYYFCSVQCLPVIFIVYGPFEYNNACADPEGGGVGGPDPLKNHKNIGFLSNIGLDPLKITKLPSHHSMLCHRQHTAKRHLNGVSLAGRCWPAYSGIFILPFLINLKQVTVGPPPPPDKTFWIRACNVTDSYFKVKQALNAHVRPIV